MPRIQLTDGYYSRTYTVESSDTNLLNTWLWETLHRLESPVHHPAELRISPMFDQSGRPDWSPDASREFLAQLRGERPVDNIRGLSRALAEFADRLEGTESSS